MRKQLIYAFAAAMTIILAVSCNGKSGTGAEAANDSIAVADTVEPTGNDAINKALKFYAGISKQGITINEPDSKAWDSYSKTIKEYIAKSQNTMTMVENIANTDFADFRNKIDYVFYPFSGADFIYPITLYPDADTYFMCGLEKPGTPISSDVTTSFTHYEAYRQALQTFFRASYFITKEMHGDFHNKELDGVCPVLTMLMAIKNYEIISIKYKNLNAQGHFTDTNDKSNILEFKFFRPGTKHTQTLYYVSGDVSNSSFDANLKAYLSKTLPQHTVGTYLKAASFLMHSNTFSLIRDFVINHSYSVIEDDSGIPYRYFTNYHVTLYGKYKRPKSEFPSSCYQPDLEALYADSTQHVRPLPFRIGYNYPSNWLVARRKGEK